MPGPWSLRARPAPAPPSPGAQRAWLRPLGEQAFSRAAGAPLVPGNRVRLLRDAAENFPAWLRAIERAERSVWFEAYILAGDQIGTRFARALAEKARQGVQVRVLHDWLGGLGEADRGFWRRLAAAGVEVRCFNPPRLESPLAFLRRDHRKCTVVDGELGFVSGLCVADRWCGDPARGEPPWRDSGLEVRGPAVADLARAFARTWAEAGPAIPLGELPDPSDLPAAGDTAVRVVATEPATAGLLRLDQLIAAVARERLWITDAYYVGMPSYVQALRGAAADGVDVRFLVPGRSDLGLVKRLGTAGYRPLLEAGVRLFEWSGPMLHAKTAVADGRWARVGSSNLNASSFMGNWELDVAVEDEAFGAEMERQFEADLATATEVVLSRRRRPVHGPPAPRPRVREGSAVATAGAMRLGNAVGAALSGHRLLGPAEASLLLFAGLALLGLVVVTGLYPRAVLAPFLVLGAWIGVALVLRGVRLWRERPPPEGPPPPAA
ncbi:phospholipase D-like domain-containing protein [Anaeromyxobacter paludicola]|uniref:PLD phosphodiesterase domain-containing protein n=1 Tax=Anaeromyxobacter paludicola TaxID=2918171 RepID=A0ABN6N985_9BACT|nr:phospholipase D-like domain-containing protein [Anaeromyxobacter paludicola]BDG09797.1 hypothetical protein AMPC_29100 [Anaeromyxobacter paludicola]